MKKLRRKLTAGESAVLALLLLCMVLVVAVTGIRIASRNQEEDFNQFVELEQMKETEPDLENSKTDKADLAQTDPAKTDPEEDVRQVIGEFVINEEMDLIAAEDQVNVVLEPETKSEEDEGEASVPVTSQAVTPAAETVFHFAETEQLAWPVSGNVILDYRMDGSIYFPTLKQYKYNPAVVISAEEGTPVSAGVSGKVLSVGIHEETGTTVTMDLGDGYTAIYGQLKEVSVTEGDLVSEQDVIGYINAPSKYYTVEGSNLYFALQKDGAPVDPLDYLK